MTATTWVVRRAEWRALPKVGRKEAQWVACLADNLAEWMGGWMVVLKVARLVARLAALREMR